MTNLPCPIPLVEDVLAPYIHSRDEALRIRRTISDHIRAQVHDELPVSHLSLVTPASSLEVRHIFPTTDGLYRQYLEALAAHRRAQEKYRSLRNELGQLQRRREESRSEDTAGSQSSGFREYIDLLRRRQAANKLEIIQSAFTQIQDADPNPARTDARALVKERLGDPPQPPIVGVDRQAEIAEKVNALVFRLKKDLLLAKSRLGEAKAAEAEAEQRSSILPDSSAGAQLAALRSARDTLITWIEGELAKVPEEDGDTSDAALEEYVNEDDYDDISNAAVSKQVQELYDLYNETRKDLITLVEATITQSQAQRQKGQQKQEMAQTEPGAAVSVRAGSEDPRRRREEQHSLGSAEVLPFISPLLAISRAETLLLHHSSHLRRQLALNSNEILSTIQRLAGESYLVPPEATTLQTWANAAEIAAQKTEMSVKEQLGAGEESLESAKRVLDMMSRRREACKSIKGDV